VKPKPAEAHANGLKLIEVVEGVEGVEGVEVD
jgi:hypothetical protein